MDSAVTAANKVKVSDMEAFCELEREMQVRHRIYDKWVTDGRLSWADARDRYARMRHACAVLKRIVDAETPTEQPFSPQVVNG